MEMLLIDSDKSLLNKADTELTLELFSKSILCLLSYDVLPRHMMPICRLWVYNSQLFRFQYYVTNFDSFFKNSEESICYCISRNMKAAAL